MSYYDGKVQSEFNLQDRGRIFLNRNESTRPDTSLFMEANLERAANEIRFSKKYQNKLA